MKLKRLVLCGFKSFADRTEFDFDEGATCIVGPNGCGKSNVVDAIKWVLGEQSAKSLRGAEMMDVIFNGSSTRRPAGSAEVTMIFDNSSGLLKPVLETTQLSDTVSITRRLFRNGNSEYLINKTPARLKDIREMFMDTGVGVDAYSVIEQGRVEGFLQASPEDRRAIFDEAAGISKYKARKKEALRKLERVEQNLLRINDVLQEIQKRLRSVKHQAGRARSHQQYAEQLNSLQSLSYLSQYHRLSQVRRELQGNLDAQTDALSALAGRIEQLEGSRTSAEIEAADIERSAREVDSKLASVVASISACLERSQMLGSRIKELGEQVVTAAGRCEELEAKIEQFQQAMTQKQDELLALDSSSKEMTGKYDLLRQKHTEGELALTTLQARMEDEKAGTIDIFRRTAMLHNTISGLGIRRENLSSQQRRLTGRASEIDQMLGGILTERGQLEAKLSDVQGVLADTQARLDQTRQESKQVHDSEQELSAKLGEAREQRSGIQARCKALSEMQHRLEGVGVGVKRVLEARRKGRFAAIEGMLGDFIQSDMQHAPLVEAALAGADQQLVVRSFEQLEPTIKELSQVLGDQASVEILCLDRMEPLSSDFDLKNCRQALGRVMDFVRCDDWLSSALWRVLGSTVLVETLADAFAASAICPAGYRFVTRAGEVLESQGRLRLGAGKRSAGVVVRRSELAESQLRDNQLQALIEELSQKCSSAKNQRQHLEDLQQKLRTAIYEANTARVECDGRLKALSEQIARLERERPVIAGEVEHLVRETDESVRQEQEAKIKATELEQINSERQKGIEVLTVEISQARQRQQEVGGQLTEMKIALASAQQRMLSVRETLSSLARQREQMSHDLKGLRAEIDLNHQRRQDAQDGIAKSLEEKVRLETQQKTLQTESVDLAESQKGLQDKINEIRRLLTQQRTEQEQGSQKAGQLRVELGEADVRIENLITRASDDMHMSLLEAFASYQHDDARDWAAVETEIRELKARIDRLGNVNLDAISEQDELEQREKFLTEQLADIQSSKSQLEELIRTINKESRDLFVSTFETVRVNFQDLFRKLFGGGRSDLILLNPDDVLESDIDIIARPPGKETRSLMLLSGGEKTMTALALLFSIFKSKPSPFCLLDEVDAALDEANNERFNRLVTEFVSTSQFLIISHSKRTMSMANVLYGVTMQDPGISKRISVRFEDAGKILDDELETASA